MTTKRGKKVSTPKKGLGQNRTRPDACFQMQQIIGRGLQDYDDHVPSTAHSRTLSSTMPSSISHTYTCFTYLIISNCSQRHPRLRMKASKKKTSTGLLSHLLPVYGPYQLLSCLATILPTVLADQNVTVDDQDPSILYSPQGAWALSANNSLDFGGAHMLTQNPNATAVFNFTGIAVYYFSPLWPYTVNTAVSLDSGNVTLIDLVDHSRQNTGQGPETVQSSVVWSAVGLANEPHVLTISVGAGQPFAVVDALIYTNTNPAIASSSSSASHTSTTDRVIASSTSTSQVSSSSKHILPVALGTVFGILALLLLIIAIWFFFKNKRQKRPISEWTVDGTAFSGAGLDGGPNGRYVNPTPSHPQGKSGWDLSRTYYGGGWYSNGNGNGYPMEQNQQGTWQNSRYANVGMPAPSIPAQDMGSRAPNRYIPGYTLSTITEKSTPKMADGGLRTPVGVGAHSPASVQTAGSNNLPETGEYNPPVPAVSRSAGTSSPAANSYPNASNGVPGHGVNGRSDHRHGGSTPLQHYSKPTGNWL